ncbi:MAG: AbrB/MazE/SpoVT family DNA-binding domain-containing protein [Nitrospinota bacterium]|nr:MAG: AbrB/MazE/SpoVT family DNA-binding domain-containing protein [Nitrospinota bacterium]
MISAGVFAYAQRRAHFFGEGRTDQTIKEREMPRVKLGAGRQITIPAQTIKRLGIQIGEEIKVVETDKTIIGRIWPNIIRRKWSNI